MIKAFLKKQEFAEASVYVTKYRLLTDSSKCRNHCPTPHQENALFLWAKVFSYISSSFGVVSHEKTNSRFPSSSGPCQPGRYLSVIQSPFSCLPLGENDPQGRRRVGDSGQSCHFFKLFLLMCFVFSICIIFSYFLFHS